MDKYPKRKPKKNEESIFDLNQDSDKAMFTLKTLTKLISIQEIYCSNLKRDSEEMKLTLKHTKQ